MDKIKELSAHDLVGQYVKVRSDKPGGQMFGYFAEAFPDDTGGGYVYYFAEKRYVPVAVTRCTRVPTWDITDGFRDVLVTVDDFGEGHIYEQFCDGSTFKVRVRNAKGLMTTVPFLAVTVKLPLRT